MFFATLFYKHDYNSNSLLLFTHKTFAKMTRFPFIKLHYYLIIVFLYFLSYKQKLGPTANFIELPVIIPSMISLVALVEVLTQLK